MTTTARARTARPALRWRNRRPIERSSSRSGLWLLALALLVFFQLHVGGFITQGNIVQILTNLAPTLIAAIPAARLLVTGNVDLSIAGGYALLGVVCGFVVSGTGSVLLGIVVTLAAGAVVGAVNGVLVRVLKISPIIVTLGLGTVYTALAFISTNGNPIYDFPVLLGDIFNTTIAGVPVSVLVALAAFAIGAFLLARTVSGLHSYAIGGSFAAAELSGIRAKRHVLWLYVWMGLSVGLLAVVTTASIGSASPTNGVGFEIDVLTAVILGGVAFNGGAGRWTGILIGVVVLGILQAGFVFEGMNSYYQLLAKGLLLLVALGADQIVAARRRGRGTAAAAVTASTAPLAAPPRRVQPDGAQPESGGIRCVDLRKSYGAVTAVDGVSFGARRGEVTCLLGDNGAGKSTLIKMLSGVLEPDAGSISIDESPVHFGEPADAQAAGVYTVYQDLALATNLGAALNLVLGAEPYRRGWKWLGLLDRRAAEDTARERVAALGVDLTDYFRPVGELSGGQRQSVAIARVNVGDASVIILDEPTAALGVKQTANVLRLARTLAERGAAVVMITHDVDSVMEIADHVVVLNLGKVLFEGRIAEVDAGRLIHLMAGYAVTEPEPGPAATQLSKTDVVGAGARP